MTRTNYDGTFTEMHVALNKQYRVKEKLEQLKAELKKLFPVWEISDVDLSKPQDPSIYIKYNDHIKIQCMLKSTTDNVIVNIIPCQNTKDYRAMFVPLGEALKLEIKGKKTPYIKLPGWKENVPKLQDSIMVIDRLQQAWNTLDSVFNR